MKLNLSQYIIYKLTQGLEAFFNVTQLSWIRIPDGLWEFV